MDRPDLSTDARKSAQISVAEIDLGEKMRHSEAQDTQPLAAGANDPAGAITSRVAFRRPSGLFSAGSGG